MPNEKRFYRKHMRFRSVLSSIGVLLMVIVMVLAFIFFWFRRYIVYTEDGLYLDIPLLNEAREKNPPQENDDIVIPIPSVPEEPTDDTPPKDADAPENADAPVDAEMPPEDTPPQENENTDE